MANTKSARKRIRIHERNRARNRAARSALRTQVKKFRASLEVGDPTAAEAQLRAAHASIDRTARKGIIHERTASRYKSRLAKAHQRMAGGATS